MSAALYYLALAFLFTHELDAVAHAEWRLLFHLRGMPDESALPRFVALHVPFFFFLLWLSHAPRPSLREGVRRTVAALLVVHAALHLRLASAPLYDFHGPLSQVLIFGAAALGLAYLVVAWRARGEEA